MPPDRIHVVLDEHDTPACARWAISHHDLARHSITVRPTPPITPRSLARDLLRALGKRFGSAGTRGAPADLWPAVGLWLEAERVRHLLILRSHLLTPDLSNRLIWLAEALHIDLWLIAGTGHPPDGINPRACRVSTFEEQQTINPAPTRPPTPSSRSWPSLPDEEYFSFRVAAHVLLDEHDHRRIDAELFVGRMIAEEWIQPHRREGRRIEAGDIPALLAAVLATAAEAEQALCRIRGTQAALFRAGIHVAAPADAIRAAVAARCAPLDHHASQLLRTFIDPHRAAAAVLSLAADLPACQLQGIDIGDVNADGRDVTIARRRVPIAATARGILLAQRLARLRDGADDAAPLFINRTGDRASTTALARSLKTVSEATGLTINTYAGSTQPRECWPADHVTMTALDQTGWEIAA